MRYNLAPWVLNLEPYTFLLTSHALRYNLTPHALCYNLTPQVSNLEPYSFLLTPVHCNTT